MAENEDRWFGFGGGWIWWIIIIFIIILIFCPGVFGGFGCNNACAGGIRE